MQDERTQKLFYGPPEPSSQLDQHPVPPDPMTEACLHFYRFDAKLLHFLGFHSQLSLLVGNFHKYAEEILIEFKNKEAEKLFNRYAARNPS